MNIYKTFFFYDFFLFSSRWVGGEVYHLLNWKGKSILSIHANFVSNILTHGNNIREYVFFFFFLLQNLSKTPSRRDKQTIESGKQCRKNIDEKLLASRHFAKSIYSSSSSSWLNRSWINLESLVWWELCNVLRAKARLLG